MAKFLPGPAVAAASGSIGGTVFAHNKGGMYIRNRSIPTTSTTEKALAQKARMAAASQAWQGLTAAQRLAWLEWANENPVIDKLGQSMNLTGHQAYCGNYSRMSLAGETPLTIPPITPAPAPLLTATLNLDIGVGAFDVTYTATPLGADDALWLVANVHNSAAINYVENIKRWIGVSAAAQASPYDFESDIEGVFGTLGVGQYITLFSHVFDTVTGLLSPPLRADGVTVST